ncbi:MAG: type II secretion system GspH family protein [Ruminococcus sp.]|jgi:prepilin-type N-terminal cleavage/methylation domain-containing protein|nr:type II secretion system GspH family protein [Ruminococcus sp.]
MTVKKSLWSKTKRFRAFTLVECLVALAILGVATLTMAQVYSSVARMSRDNEFMNISLSEQMKYVEARGGDTVNAVGIESTPTAIEKTTHVVDPTTYQVAVTGGPVNNAGTVDSAYSTYKYAYGVDMYVLYSRDVNDTMDGGTGYAWDGMYDESNGRLRYKYLLPRKPL